MLKRFLAALLWFYAGWYAGAMIAFHLGITEFLGPIIGTAAAALIAGDPRRAIWVRTPLPDAGEAGVSPQATRKGMVGPA